MTPSSAHCSSGSAQDRASFAAAIARGRRKRREEVATNDGQVLEEERRHLPNPAT